jgi:acyl-CoA synthetase (AMP-forming)/AMP-acid ligase II
VAALARHLAATAAPGEVVALLLPNSVEFHVAYFAAVKALAAPALLNPLYPALQLSPLLRDVAPRAVVCTPATRELVLGLARPTPLITAAVTDSSFPARACPQLDGGLPLGPLPYSIGRSSRSRHAWPRQARNSVRRVASASISSLSAVGSMLSS